MKIGTFLGHYDINNDKICVGDYVRNIHTNVVYIVNSYGSLQNDATCVKFKTMANSLVLVSPEEAKELEGTCGSASPKVPSDNTLSEESLARKHKQVVKKADEPRAERSPKGIADFTDEQLVKELRKRGFEVKATKVVTIEL